MAPGFQWFPDPRHAHDSVDCGDEVKIVGRSLVPAGTCPPGRGDGNRLVLEFRQNMCFPRYGVPIGAVDASLRQYFCQFPVAEKSSHSN